MNFKKLTSDAATVFNRAVQFTEEKLGKAERTEFEPPLENLIQRADRTEDYTKKILSLIEAYLQPNPTARLEEAFYEKLDIKKDPNQVRTNNLDHLGQAMQDAGQEFGPETEYGAALLKVSNTQFKLATADREFVYATLVNVLTPLKRFLEGDMKTVAKEKKVLVTKRLDLDACKAKLKKARAVEGTAAAAKCITPEQAEAEVRIAQSEFDKQSEILKLLLEGVESSKANHLRVLRDFVDAQMAFYALAHQHMADLQRELTGQPAGMHSSPNAFQGYQNHTNSVHGTGTGAIPYSGLDPVDMGTKRAQALFDYDAVNPNELSVRKGDVLIIYRLPGLDPELVMAEKGNQRGRLPLSYLEIVS